MDYGYIECLIHGKKQRAWFICRHIKTSEDVYYREPWTKKEGGTLCCEIEPEKHGTDDLVLICEEHLKEMGLFEHVH
jgi:hypothetical protein